MPNILELIQRCLSDDERTEPLVKLAFGLIGDLADCFPNGEIKGYLLQEWIANELRNKRGLSAEAKKTMRWAKEVCHHFYYHIIFLQPLKPFFFRWLNGLLHRHFLFEIFPSPS